jgi:hypothetical protein
MIHKRWVENNPREIEPWVVNSKLGHDNWEAYFNNFWWNGERVNGCLTKPINGQEIRVAPSWRPSEKLEERQI